MNHKVLTTYGILERDQVKGEDFEWAARTTIVVDKQGVIQHVEQGDGAVNPNTAVAICTGIHEKHGATK
jgi:peroxiredoxin